MLVESPYYLAFSMILAIAKLTNGQSNLNIEYLTSFNTFSNSTRNVAWKKNFRIL